MRNKKGEPKREPKRGCMNKRRVGTDYEALAAQYLKQQGLRIIDKNFRCRQGEIDLIAYDGSYYIFAEVKYRRTAESGDPAEAVDYRKQIKICRAADFYRISRRVPASAPVRFDVVAILDRQVTWYKNAFYYVGSL